MWLGHLRKPSSPEALNPMDVRARAYSGLSNSQLRRFRTRLLFCNFCPLLCIPISERCVQQDAAHSRCELRSLSARQCVLKVVEACS